jgi:redox-sensitive bicupin YhaK (pirin superfamily)
MSIRPIKKLLTAQPTLEGAGVHLRRGFGFGETQDTDPFLLFDDFRNDRPEDFLAGFPWHPHRGIETITYVLEGTVEHGDSLGNVGTLGAGDVQWMTAGSGIIHQEMPKGTPEGRMHGFQLWCNLPSSLKMTAPRYQDIQAAEIPEVVEDDGVRARVICGSFWGAEGPVSGVSADPCYVDITVPPGTTRRLPVDRQRQVFVYVFDGAGSFRDASAPMPVATEVNDQIVMSKVEDRSLVVFDTGDEIQLQAGDHGLRFLLVSGMPLREPVAWHGPIVMNTQEELETAFAEYRAGTFLKSPNALL